MSDENAAVCFTCGQPSGDVLRLNTLTSGQVCPTCRDRLLESIPSALPQDQEAPSASVSEEEEESDPFEISASRGPGQLLLGGGPVEPA